MRKIFEKKWSFRKRSKRKNIPMSALWKIDFESYMIENIICCSERKVVNWKISAAFHWKLKKSKMWMFYWNFKRNSILNIFKLQILHLSNFTWNEKNVDFFGNLLVWSLWSTSLESALKITLSIFATWKLVRIFFEIANPEKRI